MFDLDPILESGINVGLETLLLLPILVGLEAVLSADNAIALAAIARGLPDQQMQRRALNFGLAMAFVLRMLLIVTATWVIHYWQVELLGAVYLLWLSLQYFFSQEVDQGEDEAHHHRFHSLWQAIPLIAVTDLAFSLDSVTAAIAISDETWLVLTGAAIGIITLRFLAGLFIRWLDQYVHLEDAGYMAVGLVGVRLLVRVIAPDLVPPDWGMIVFIVILFIWGFSKQKVRD
jgi:YkoY family integral membrane protein